MSTDAGQRSTHVDVCGSVGKTVAGLITKWLQSRESRVNETVWLLKAKETCTLVFEVKF